MPTLSEAGAYAFYPGANVSKEVVNRASKMKPIDIITELIKRKKTRTGLVNRLYIMQGHTGSGKSTLMITHLFDKLVRGSKKLLWCTEPRVVLASGNAYDVLTYNKWLTMGENIGVMTGGIKIQCTNSNCIYYSTTQILTDKLNSVLTASNPIKQLSKFSIIVVDECHELDSAMVNLLLAVKKILNKFSYHPECPVVIVTSATLDIPLFTTYFLDSSALTNPDVIGIVHGESNFPVEHRYLPSTDDYKSTKDLANYIGKLNIKSTAYVNNYQCRDMLVFVPSTKLIKAIGAQLEERFKPSLFITPGMEMSAVVAWRNKNRDKRRTLIVGVARGYATASDAVLDYPIDPDVEAATNETKIFISTNVLESGKTIGLLHVVIDTGIGFGVYRAPLFYNVMNPRSSNPSVLIEPIDRFSLTQRNGRVGRKAPGVVIHMYSEKAANSLRDRIPNFQSGSADVVESFVTNYFKEYSLMDVFNGIDFITPPPIDTLLRTMSIMSNLGYATPFGQFLSVTSPSWIQFAGYYYYIEEIGLFPSLMLASINRYRNQGMALPPNSSLLLVDYQTLQKIHTIRETIYKLEPNINQYIQEARNVFTRIAYGIDYTLTYNPDRVY